MTTRMCRHWASILALLVCASPVRAAESKPVPHMSSLDLAQRAYDQGRYSDAIGMLLGPAGGNAEPGPQAEIARELLARCWVRAGDLQRAREAYLRILRDQPTYRPDPLKLKPDEIQAFNSALGESRSGNLRTEVPRAPHGPSRTSLCAGLDGGLGLNFGTPSFRGIEFGGFVGANVGSRTAVALEGLLLSRSRDVPPEENADQHEEAKGFAVVAEVRRQLGGGAGSSRHVVVLAGAGPLLGVSYQVGAADAPLGIRKETGTGLYAHAGLEIQMPLGKTASPALSFRLVGRYARASLSPDPTGDPFKLTLSGVALTVGLRFSGSQ